MPNCKSCGAEIIWATTGKGNAIPLDAKPEHRFVIVPLMGHPENLRAEYIKTYISHFATCPQAEQHRKKPRSKCSR
jgi:hypothetical protein